MPAPSYARLRAERLLLASQILDEATTQFGSTQMMLTDAVAAAAEIREATSVWPDALGPLRPFFSVGTEEALPPMAARLDDDRLTALWYRGAEAMPPSLPAERRGP